jgi:23S rRNA (guanosine2251-2'-O)-methyltransferase
MTLSLHNPHSVLAALEMRPHDVLEVRVPPGKPSSGWAEVVEAARARQIPVRTELAEAPKARSRDDKSARLSAASANIVECRETNLDVFFKPSGDGTPGLWLALDCLQDPHNVGAIFRTAAFFGIRGILVTKDRSAPLSGTVYDVASGGMEHVPFAQPTNLSQALKLAKDAGLWVLGSSEHATQSVSAIDRGRPWLLVVGNEEQGLRRLTLDLCDEVCKIPGEGAVGSLNVSVATGILLASLAGDL